MQNIENHLSNLRSAVQSFLENNNNFEDLLDFVRSKFNVVDEEMFKEWVEKEFPNQIKL